LAASDTERIQRRHDVPARLDAGSGAALAFTLPPSSGRLAIGAVLHRSEVLQGPRVVGCAGGSQ
jgi:hypothetical protein